MEECFNGDHRTVDMTVEDIYGGDYSSLGLNKDIIASSMGKAKSAEPGSFKTADVARSIMIMICINVAQLAHLVSETENIDTIVVIGSILTHLGFQKVLKSFMDFWGKGKKSIVFPENTEYLGCMGMALEMEEVQDQEIKPKECSIPN